MFENTASIQDLFSTRNIIIYFVVINLVGFLIMFTDKQKAIDKAYQMRFDAVQALYLKIEQLMHMEFN